MLRSVAAIIVGAAGGLALLVVLVGVGSFGLVYKGLLLDGTAVAIKRRHGAPSQEFFPLPVYHSRLDEIFLPLFLIVFHV